LPVATAHAGRAAWPPARDCRRAATGWQARRFGQRAACGLCVAPGRCALPEPSFGPTRSEATRPASDPDKAVCSDSGKRVSPIKKFVQSHEPAKRRKMRNDFSPSRVDLQKGPHLEPLRPVTNEVQEFASFAEKKGQVVSLSSTEGHPQRVGAGSATSNAQDSGVVLQILHGSCAAQM
jgi:hypothetical protein